MPPKKTQVTNDAFVPSQKEFIAKFITRKSGDAKTQEVTKSIFADSFTAACRIADRMCNNPMIFPPNTIARIPAKNITEVKH